MRNRHLFVLTILGAILFGGCSPGADEPVQSRGAAPYFSLETYFAEEAARMQRTSPTVRKTVKKNNDTEDREMAIRSWVNELELFRLSDINMEAWIGKYAVDSGQHYVEYRATDPELRTRRIVIHRSDEGEIRHIHVANEASNMLYTSKELLDYYPDSLYVIEKRQDIRWWSDNTYTITGRIGASQE